MASQGWPSSSSASAVHRVDRATSRGRPEGSHRTADSSSPASQRWAASPGLKGGCSGSPSRPTTVATTTLRSFIRFGSVSNFNQRAKARWRVLPSAPVTVAASWRRQILERSRRELDHDRAGFFGPKGVESVDSGKQQVEGRRRVPRGHRQLGGDHGSRTAPWIVGDSSQSGPRRVDFPVPDFEEAEHEFTTIPRRARADPADPRPGQIELAPAKTQPSQKQPPIIGGLEANGPLGGLHRLIHVPAEFVGPTEMDLQTPPGVRPPRSARWPCDTTSPLSTSHRGGRNNVPEDRPPRAEGFGCF